MANKTTVYLMSVIISLLIAAASSETPVSAYTNHTVGGAAGWFFDVTTNTSSADFSAWAANETFSLGDYLIFNTNTNQTVIGTYNQTTYQNCSVDFSDNGDTFQYGGGNSQLGVPTVIAVALVNKGPGYYFSSASDGIQCLNGMAFEISVQHGLGLPSSLNQPPPPPYAEPPSEEDSPSPPITVDTNQFSSGGVGNGANVCRRLVVLFGVALLCCAKIPLEQALAQA